MTARALLLLLLLAASSALAELANIAANKL